MIALEHIREDDVRTLVRHPDAEHRARAAQRICHVLRKAKLSDAERKFARQLLDFMADDAVAIVRRALAVALKNSPELPRELALKLALDVDSIATPVLSSSPVFTDEDLIEILRSKAAAKVIAVAKRPFVSGSVVRAIIRYGDSKAVAEVAANDGAVIEASVADTILDIYHDDDLIKEAFITRRDLPTSVMEKLITIVSEEAALILSQRHDIPVEVAVDIANRARERATINIVELDMKDRELHLFIKRMADSGRLTPSFLIRAVGFGRMRILKYALSVMGEVSPSKANLMIHDGGPFGLKALCVKAGLNDNESKFIRAACAIYRDIEISGLEYDQTYFQTLMLERILTLPITIDEADQNWFLERLDALEEA